MSDIYEPPIKPDEDTNPSIAMRPVDWDEHEDDVPSLQTAIGWLSLLGATLFTLATIIVLFLPQDEPNTTLLQINTEPTAIVEAATEPGVATLPTIPPTATVEFVQ
jgi:hypothetical protein